MVKKWNEMDNQKLEDSLGFALSLDKDKLSKLNELGAGYRAQQNEWELIVKYNGDIQYLQSEKVKVEPLIAGYAILTLPEERIYDIANIPQIEFIEKPKRLFPQMVDGLRSACFTLALESLSDAFLETYSRGKGVLLAIIDSGIDYTLSQFREADGSTKIDWIYDQTTGNEYNREQIQESLHLFDQKRTNTAIEFVPLTTDFTGHGTNVATIATRAATSSRLIVVKLDTSNQQSYPLTTSLMRAVNYVVEKAASLSMPVAINISFGTTYGSHDGKSLLERFIDNAAEYGRVTLCVGTGNEGASSGHFNGDMKQDKKVEFTVGGYERNLSIQIWKSFADHVFFKITSPSGSSYMIDSQSKDSVNKMISLDNTRVIVFVGEPQPYQSQEEIYIVFEPEDSMYLISGIWQIEFLINEVVNGAYKIYMPSQAIRSSETGFLNPSPEETLTIPSTAARVISVGAYNSYYNAYAQFSGRGQFRVPSTVAAQLQKPDIVAPGVNIQIPHGEKTEVVSGTSYATPFVTGAAACLMSYGIVTGKDPYMYGEKVKAYLIKGAKRFSGYEQWPNAVVGWGALCLRNSLAQI